MFLGLNGLHQSSASEEKQQKRLASSSDHEIQ